MEDIEKEIAGEEVQDEQLIKEELFDNQENVKEDNSDIVLSNDDDNDDDFFDDKKKNKGKEDDTIRFNKRGSNDDKKRNIIIIILIVIAVFLIGVIGVIALTRKDNNTKSNEDNTFNEAKEVVKEEETTSKKVSYVSCDDNTSLLNVRNSSTGDIIDGLSCFKEVEVLEEVDGTDTCDKWYRVSYEKRNNSYTGYVCSKYIKDSSSDSTSIKRMKEVIDKANKYYEDNQVMVYCGDTNGTKTVNINEDGHTFEGQYLKSEFKSIDELKKYLLTFLDESLIKVKLEVSDSNNPKMYDNYYEIDGNLYCRNYSGKGWMTFYTDNYDIEVVSETDNKVNLRIAYEYLDESKLDEDGKCSLQSISSCPNSYFKYVIGNITLSKDNDNYIVTSMNFHD